MSKFSGWVLGFLTYRIPFANKNTPTSSFLIAYLAVADFPSSILNNSGKSRPDFSGNYTNFSPFNMMLGIALLFIAFIMLKYVPYSEFFFQEFNMDGCWILSKSLCLSDSLNLEIERSSSLEQRQKTYMRDFQTALGNQEITFCTSLLNDFLLKAGYRNAHLLSQNSEGTDWRIIASLHHTVSVKPASWTTWDLISKTE